MDAQGWPDLGARVGIRYGDNGHFLPFVVAAHTANALYATSPIFGDASCQFAFARPLEGEIEWQWKPWTECPALREFCRKCTGMGEVKSKKPGETYRSCPKCDGIGTVERHDPFTTQD